jgi:hypothetical protein
MSFASQRERMSQGKRATCAARSGLAHQKDEAGVELCGKRIAGLHGAGSHRQQPCAAAATVSVPFTKRTPR